MCENYEYYDWECTVCGKCVCHTTCREKPETKVSSQGVYLNACRSGYVAKWVQVRTHQRNMDLVQEMFS